MAANKHHSAVALSDDLILSSPDNKTSNSFTEVEFSQNLEVVGAASSVSGNTASYEKDRSRTDMDAENLDHEPPMSINRLMSLIALSFLFTGSQIPLYLFGGISFYIYSDLGGVDRVAWFVLGNLLALAAVCPFVGALSDLLGRRYVALSGAIFIILGIIVSSTAHSMNIFIAGMALAGVGSGICELTALAATSELAPAAKRGKYIAVLVSTILPFWPSTLWAQLIASHSSWRYVGLFCGLWIFIGLLLTAIFYFPPPRVNSAGLTKKQIIAQIDFVGGLLSISGVICFVGGLIWGGGQYAWQDVHVLAPLLIGVGLLVAFGFWETYGAKYPMFPSRLKKGSRTLILTLVITFISGSNFFSIVVFWPVQSFDVYGHDPIGVGIRALPPTFGTILGAVIVLWLLSIFRGRYKLLMIVSCSIMTAGCGAMAVANPDNLSTVYGITFLAGIGIGGIVLPASVITTIICPDDLIATITALTLAIRVIGGSVGYTIYYSVLTNKLGPKLVANIATACVTNGIMDPTTIEDAVKLTAVGYIDQMLLLPGVHGNLTIWNDLVMAGKESFSYAYSYVYYTSIGFGVVSLIAALFLGDISQYMDNHVAVIIR